MAATPDTPDTHSMNFIPVEVPPANLVRSSTHLIPGQLQVTEYFFSVPLNYSNRSHGSIELFARSANKYEKPIVPLPNAEHQSNHDKPWFVYLEGGPGFGNREPQESTVTRVALSRGYQVLFLDYRGTGLSTPVNARSLKSLGGSQQQADYLKFFRQDSIVRDLEAVRQYLTQTYPEEKKAWTIFGQSFGGFVSLTYLSFFQHGLREVFLTGGLAPIGMTPVEVYKATIAKVAERNEAYYKKYPHDAKIVKDIAFWLASQGGKIPLPAGGYLDTPRLLSLGLSFGGHGGLDTVHGLLLKLEADLIQHGHLTRTSLTAIEQFIPFDCNPIYAILHEAIYCTQPGIASNWAAFRVASATEGFAWVARPELYGPAALAGPRPLYFLGEMVLPSHFESFPELAEMAGAAEALARFDGWPPLYDEDRLARGAVPVYAASFADDMYVDFGLARRAAAMVGGIRVYETNALYHNAIRARPDDVLRELFRLRDDSLD